MGTPGPAPEVSLEDTLRVFTGSNRTLEPYTTPEIAEAVGCARRTAHRKLQRLADRGEIESKKVGASGRVWWRPAARSDTTNGGGTNEPAPFEEFVREVKDIAIFTLDSEGHVSSWNAGAERIKGFKAGDIIGKHFSEFYTAEDRERGVPADNLETARTAGRIEDEGWRVRHDGSRFWANVVITAIRDDDGGIKGFTKVTRDLTERRKRERELERRKRELETELGEILGRISDGFYAVDDEWRLTHINERAEEILQQSADAVLGESLWEVLAGGDDGLIAQKYREAMESMEPVSFELHDESVDAWLEVSAYPSETGLSVYFRDISDRLARERELERYERIIETIEDGVYIVDVEGRFSMVNNAYAEMVGYHRDDLLGEPVSLVVNEETMDAASHLEAELEAGERETARLEADLLRADGETVRAEATFAMLPGEEGLERVGVVRDVTDRVERERALEESERRYRTLVENFPNGAVTMFDEDLRYLAVGGENINTQGQDPGAMEGEPLEDVLPPGLVEPLIPRYRAAVEDGERSRFEVEHEGRHYQFQALPVLDADGEVFAGMGVSLDVTERVERERALEEYERIVETVDDGVYVLDDHGRFLRVNDAFVSMTSLSRDELLGSHASSVFGETFDELDGEVRRQFEAGLEEVAAFEAEIYPADGDPITVENRFKALDIAGGRGRVGVVRDMTDRKEYERTLRRYETLIEESTDVNAIIDPDGTLEYVTPSVEYVLGYEADELVGENAFDYLHPDDREPVADAFANIVEGAGRPALTEFRFEHADGSWVWLEARSRDLRDDPSVEGLVVYTRDVTERKAYEYQLEVRARQQSAIAELGREALENQDLDTLFDRAARLVADVLDNDYCKVLDLDRDAEELQLRQGVGWRDGVVGNATVSAVEADSQASYTLQSDEPVVVTDLATETRFSGPELLTSHDVRSGISTVIGPSNEPWGILGTHDTARKEFTAEDVSFVQGVANVLAEAIGRQRFKDELEELVAELEESNERLEQFAYVASHDLQEPLRMVTNYLQLLESRYGDEFDEDAEEFIGYAVDGAERMREMINGLLTYSRVDTEAEPLEPVDCNALVERARRSVGLQIEETNATVDVGWLPTVWADANQLEQVFQNLISNAIKYRDGPPEIEIEAERDGEVWVFRVTDDGIGIDPKQADTIFDVFTRLHTQEDYPGTGIGLALCKKIVERHGGEIWVESTPGEGSTFSFTIPVTGDSRLREPAERNDD